MRSGVPAAELHVVFAGGIHDARSAAMVAALAAPLAAAGVRIGVLMGTAYLFTQEAVAGEAIGPVFQGEALACDRTVLFEISPGHAIRCVDTPYFQTFLDLKHRLVLDGRGPDELKDELETVNAPFVEAPEYLGGFWVIDVADETTALDWAARASKALGGRIEVRAFQAPPGA